VNPEPEGRYDADVAIVGSGVAGALCAYKLALKGVKVVILEAGPRIHRPEIVEGFRTSHKQDFSAGYPNTKLAPRPDWDLLDEKYLIQDGRFPYRCEYLRVVGGTTWHWGGVSIRFTPNEFRLKSTFGVGKDWPISYEALEPYYLEAERELAVSGDPNDDFGAPRSGPYPLPPVEMGYLEKTVTEKLKPHGFRFSRLPMVRSSQATQGRPRCLGYNSCSRICPIGAMYNAIVHVNKAENLGVKLLDETLVTRLDVNEKNDVSALQFQRADGSRGKIRARAYVIAANGLETPRLLLLSPSERVPEGVANSSNQVGRNLMDHPGKVARMELKELVFPGRGPEISVSTYQFRETPARRTRAGFYLSIYNQNPIYYIAKELLEKGLMGKGLDQAIRGKVAHAVDFTSHVEQLPDPDNRVRLDPNEKDSAGLAKIRITYQLDSYVQRGINDLEKIFHKISRYLGAKKTTISPIYSNNHLMGAACMGDDARHSVTDPECRTHDHHNLFIAGSAVFPTGGTAGPTLTIAALSLRLADSILAQLKQ